MKQLAHGINAVVALASVAGVIAFGWRIWSAPHSHMLEFLWVLMLVIVPYAVLFFAIRSATSLLTSSIAFGAISICVAIAAVLYWDSYTTTDPKYVLAIWLAILSQLTVAAIGLAAVRIFRPRSPPSNMAVVSDAPAADVLDQAVGSARRTPPR
jgi:hypothetical protein